MFFRDVSGLFQRSFEGVLFHKSFKGVTMKFEGEFKCFEVVSCCMGFVAAYRAKRELVFVRKFIKVKSVWFARFKILNNLSCHLPNESEKQVERKCFADLYCLA